MTISYTEQPIDPTTHAILLQAAHPERTASWHAAVSQAFDHSSYIAAAWDESTLVGTVRVVDDGVAFALVADLLVHPNYRHHGIGSTLIKMCQSMFPNYYLYADPADAEAKEFYSTIGFEPHEIMLHPPTTNDQLVED